MVLLNSKNHCREYQDAPSREMMLKTIEFFENKGRGELKKDDHERNWYADFLEFQRKEGLFADLLTPPAYGEGNTRWDTYRNCEFNEILSFYGLAYWYAWQVSILGLGPIWMSENEAVKQRTARLLREGGIFGFGLSEREHGADLYATEMVLSPQGAHGYLANGRKYYIGNANEAALVSTFAKMSDSGDFVFFVVDSHHGKYECVKKVVNAQYFVAEYALDQYPIAEADVLSKGQAAWDAALNTVNVGKFNLGWAAIGICTHAFYEAINHAANRRLYRQYVTDFPHIKQFFIDAYARLTAMKLFALRASDYMRSASLDDRRYLLYNPIVKMKVTMQGEEVINLLWDVIAAKGFEADTYFEMAARDIRTLPKLEGTAHVNMALIIKFMRNFFFQPDTFPVVPTMMEPSHDSFLFQQGPTRGLSKIRHHDYRIAYESVDSPNVSRFREQIAVYREFLMTAGPTEEQTKDLDFLFVVGELATLVAYGQLIIENAAIHGVEEDVTEQIFDFMVRDFSKFALQLYSKSSSTSQQMDWALKMIRKPVEDCERTDRVWQNHVYALKDQYTMND